MTGGAAQARICDVASLAQDEGRRQTTREAGGSRCDPAQSPQPLNHLDNQHTVSYIRKAVGSSSEGHTAPNKHPRPL
jgi:hypothetical protein